MYYAGISECDVLNGEGFRVVLFVSGCDHRCFNCQNKKTWSPTFGHPFTEKTLDYIMSCLNKDYIDGITITGGDPLYKNNISCVLQLIKKIKKRLPNKTIWMYTGYSWEDLMNSVCGDIFDILYNIDVLVDGEYDDSLRDLTYPWAGSTNQRVIDVQKSKEFGEVVLWSKN